MPRVREPLPGEIGRALDKLNLDTYAGQEFRGVFDIQRAYDRSTGNFKAFGWKMTVGYGRDGRGFVITLTIALPDKLLAYEQGRLEL
jgi:hypothetical protein